MMFLIVSLAVWRISHMIVKDLGPFGVFARFRANRASKQKRIGGWFDMVSCIGCVSVWVGSLAALGAADGLFSWVGYTTAFSAVAMLLESVYNKFK